MTRRVDLPNPADDITLIVLAGGASTRMGRDKLHLRRGDRTLLQYVVDQLESHSGTPIRIAGPQREEIDGSVVWVGEEPPGGGPVAGIAAAVMGVETHWTVLMAGDAPDGPRAIPALLACAATLDASADGAVLMDAEGHRQPLCAIYRTTGLMQALTRIGDPRGVSMHRLLQELHLLDTPDEVGAAADIDDPADAESAGFS